MKKFLSLFLSLAMVFAILPTGLFSTKAKAATQYTDGYYTYTVSNDEATIYDVDTSISGAVTIPSTLGGYPVTSIRGEAFFKCASMTSVTIPDSVTNIGHFAFSNCSSLTTIAFGKNVKSIGRYVFEECRKLTSIDLPYGIETIEKQTFFNCTSLKNINIPITVKEIHENAFFNCDSLTSVTIPEGVTYLGNGAFADCNNITSATIPDSVEFIGDGLFSYSALYKNNVNQNLYIGNHLIKAKSSLSGAYTVQSGTKTIASGAFEDCEDLTAVSIPNSVVSIGNSAFNSCTSLVSISIPDSVTYIGAYAFYNTAYYNNTLKWKNNVLYIGNHLIEAKTTLSGTYNVISGTKSIASSAFRGCSSLAGVKFPDSVTAIGELAFYDCKKLTTANIGSGVKTINKNAFSYCSALKNITLPYGVGVITDSAFMNCTALTSIDLTNVEYIDELAFAYCSALKSVTFGDKLTFIGRAAFSGCSSLANIYYYGTEAQWNNITIGETNSDLLDATFNHLHTSGNGVITPPTCTEAGFTTYTCTSCSQSYVSDYTYKDHSYTATVISPTCTQQGYTLYTCTSCSDSYKSNYTPAQHKYVSTVTKPTCTEEGYTTYTCENCGDTYIANYTSGSHSYKETIVPPTPTDKGYSLFTCTVCGESYQANFVDPIKAVSGIKTTPSDVNVTLSWTAYSGATEYYAKVYDKNFTKCLKTITTKGTSAVFDCKVLNYNTDYKFIVTAKLSDGSYLTVADATQANGKMVIAKRVVGLSSTIEGKGAVVDFLPVENATEYLVNVFENNAQGKRIYTATLGADETEARIMNNLSAGTKYIVMINAKVDGSYMSLSDLRVKGIGTEFIAPVINPSSVTVAAETANSIRFNWDAVRGATEYYVRVKEKSTGKLVNTLKAIGKTTATLSRWTNGTRISPNTVYTLEICAYVPGVAATYGTAIEIKSIGYESVSIFAVKSGNKINMRWNSTTNAVGYFVYTYKDGVKISNKYVDGNDNVYYSINLPAASGAYTFGVIAYEKNSSGTAYTPVSISNQIVI